MESGFRILFVVHDFMLNGNQGISNDALVTLHTAAATENIKQLSLVYDTSQVL